MEPEKLPLPKEFKRPKKIESPEKLWELAQDYFKYTDENPWESGELIKSGDLAGVVVKVFKRVPYTWSGLAVHCFKLGFNTRLDEYKSNRKTGYEEYSDVIKQIDEILRTQKFTGATVGDFNANIIARDLGLADKVVTEVKDTTDDFDYDELSESALKEIAAARAKKKNG